MTRTKTTRKCYFLFFHFFFFFSVICSRFFVCTIRIFFFLCSFSYILYSVFAIRYLFVSNYPMHELISKASCIKALNINKFFNDVLCFFLSHIRQICVASKQALLFCIFVSFFFSSFTSFYHFCFFFVFVFIFCLTLNPHNKDMQIRNNGRFLSEETQKRFVLYILHVWKVILFRLW